MTTTGIEACCHHKLMLPCSVCVGSKTSWYQKNGKKSVKEEDEMKVNIDETEIKKDEVTDFLCILSQVTLMTQPDLWPSQSPRLLFVGYRVAFPVDEET